MRKIDFTEYVIKTDKLTEAYKYILISDLHSNDYGINLHKIIEVIKKEQPDGILLAGDIINRKITDNIITVIKFISAISRRYNVYYALGNHEYKLKKNEEKFGNFYQEYRRVLEEAGVVFLEDTTVLSGRGNDKLAISGVEIDSVFYHRIPPVMGDGLMDKHLGNADKDVFNLLIAHNPLYFKKYAKWGADLIVSGHMHGGTVRLPKLGGVMGTNYELFPKYDAGCYKSGNSRMIISRGIGAHTIPIRVNNPPELAIIKILAKNAQ